VQCELHEYIHNFFSLFVQIFIKSLNNLLGYSRRRFQENGNISWQLDEGRSQNISPARKLDENRRDRCLKVLRRLESNRHHVRVFFVSHCLMRLSFGFYGRIQYHRGKGALGKSRVEVLGEEGLRDYYLGHV
jgi:hypothetical protein